ncbi:MAG: hemolysin family protein, partial [Clostridiales bacterium]|nr:hemolysin family protein [Clostridiales bacterium]
MPDDGPLIQQLLVLFVLIMVGFAFSCAEIAIISINKNKMEQLAASGNKNAGRLLRLTKDPSKYLAAIQLGTTFAGFLASAFAADNISARFTRWLTEMEIALPVSVVHNLSVILITLLLSYFSIVIGELVPKRIAMKYSEKISLFVAGPMIFISTVLKPLVWMLSASANGLLRLLHINPNASEEEITEEEIRLMVDAGSEKGAIDENEKDIIHNLFEFDNMVASEVMTHRTEITLLWMEESDADWERIIKENRFTHYPICGDDQDDIVGVLNSKEYFRLDDKRREVVMNEAVRTAQFVPESVRTDMLFRNMKKNRNHFAVVLDEYGGMSGVVTMNDLLEELVGDLEDDHTAPPERPEIERIDEDTWRVEGTAPLDEVAEMLDVKLPVDEYDTFSAMVFGLLGTVPEDG